ncbi:phytanoyl-CoA dioxygenase family protein [Pseudonocardia humida]|uniref:Phytanoyl-CoA dioxygenase family protein n=1 Tax=Pseudonocardia humida TaxID=2800819 RepID=A0ABT1A8X8_9PSEU|nr:phytanoyl-CoA dioxygenase family protein [Pseudonocardia humida]MCO1659458.1 phytanoyl-CoA dioxygenase family protein [Pseudonocardia humida]
MSEPLSAAEIEQFVADGFVRLEGAFPVALADECRALLWEQVRAETGADPGDPSTWTRPVVRINGRSDPPFQAAARTPRLHAAFDQLVGPGGWHPRAGLGTFPIRFPHPDDPGDAGWHVEGSFADPDDPARFRLNLRSRGRALLMLFLFSEVGEADAPTRVRVGSHLDVAPLLAPHGDAGAEFFAFAGEAVPATEHRPTALATGAPGDVYLVHPFLVHAAQPHRGTAPRFMAQPPLLPTAEQDLDAPTPVAEAIRRGLAATSSSAPSSAPS